MADGADERDRQAELEKAKRRRQETSDRIVESSAAKKVVIAGPGTGKTYNFRRALEQVGGKGLALTFIRALRAQLEKDLGDLGQVNTLHGYCKHLAHAVGIKGLTQKFDYYPPLLLLVAQDLHLLTGDETKSEDVEGLLHHLDDRDGLLTRCLDVSAYYDAGSHTDVVYRVTAHLAENPRLVPEWPLVVVDEYQDFSKLETQFIEALATASPVLVAGDDDQALYGFKHASPEFIRELAGSADFDRFDLPYCSRCTEVIVQAVNSVVAEAQKRGKLVDRVEREFLCYLPEKLEDSQAHPAIIHAHCSVETGKARYMGRYVAEQIGRIPKEDIAQSHEDGYPTVLIIGRLHFVERVCADVKESFPQAEYRQADDLEIDALDGYRRLALDPKSRLGWRILIHAAPFGDWPGAVLPGIRDGEEISDALPDDYRERHLGIAETVALLRDNEKPSDDQAGALEEALGRSVEEVRLALGAAEDDDKGAGASPAPEAVDSADPSIICTTLLGAKGLSAGYVFIVGFNDGDFPREPGDPSDDEICKLIVALSRTRKECQVVSCGRFGLKYGIRPSSFLSWLDVQVDERSVNKEYWEERG
jgi:superfamily I DNA/RNA helicase